MKMLAIHITRVITLVPDDLLKQGHVLSEQCGQQLLDVESKDYDIKNENVITYLICQFPHLFQNPLF